MSHPPLGTAAGCLLALADQLLLLCWTQRLVSHSCKQNRALNSNRQHCEHRQSEGESTGARWQVYLHIQGLLSPALSKAPCKENRFEDLRETKSSTMNSLCSSESVAIIINLHIYLVFFLKAFVTPQTRACKYNWKVGPQWLCVFLDAESRGLSKPLIAPYLTWLLSGNVFTKQSVSFYYAIKYLLCWQNNGLNMSPQMFCWDCRFYVFLLCCVLLFKIHFGSILLPRAADAKMMQGKPPSLGNNKSR